MCKKIEGGFVYNKKTRKDIEGGASSLPKIGARYMSSWMLLSTLSVKKILSAEVKCQTLESYISNLKEEGGWHQTWSDAIHNPDSSMAANPNRLMRTKDWSNVLIIYVLDLFSVLKLYFLVRVSSGQIIHLRRVI